MTTTPRQPSRGGRPSKGDRHPFKVRVPRDAAERVMQYSDATDTPYSDVIAALVVRHIDELDTEALEYGTNRLELETA